MICQRVSAVLRYLRTGLARIVAGPRVCEACFLERNEVVATYKDRCPTCGGIALCETALADPEFEGQTKRESH